MQTTKPTAGVEFLLACADVDFVVALRELYFGIGSGQAVEIHHGYLFVFVRGGRDMALAPPSTTECSLSFDFVPRYFIALYAQDATVVGYGGVVHLQSRLLRAASGVWGLRPRAR